MMEEERTAGYKGSTGDCVVRAVAIASGLSYGEVYGQINELGEVQGEGRAGRVLLRELVSTQRRSGSRIICQVWDLSGFHVCL